MSQCVFFFQAEDGIRDGHVTGVQTCALPIWVGATRFGAKVMLDLLSGEDTELTQLELVKKKPIPFPPEPAAWLGVQVMMREMIRADRNQGKRSLFLRTMDKIGVGFDS